MDVVPAPTHSIPKGEKKLKQSKIGSFMKVEGYEELVFLLALVSGKLLLLSTNTGVYSLS